ncbi:MAG: 2-amino-4-hydroxy-6-hydroxymethyldihydropteridine diphosphokinase [Hyphomicrobium sp.]|jgi:2-amino-4-hydroxy-6-hydroxymethyldihydropteridine diphosphokinase|nr:2-amino-4-hydroxy-6-hydroxymethyldihydropteridine diphosphokinase [Hyphomicrobium sp.]PPD05877.1 MAG: 2-amino-4-hydroxy-6-hydroxymethyldihydropteridine diphosphokinase [Hyphomicrobium sp.]
MTEEALPAAYDALIGIGSNVGDKAGNIARAVGLLCADGAVRLVAMSRLYRSAPWGILEQDWFVNGAAGVATEVTPHELLRRCLAVEDAMGRVRSVKWGPRLVDVDVLTYRAETIDMPDLKVPHPFIEKRSFVLVPLLDIAADEIVRGRAVRDLAAAIDTSDCVPLG